MGSGGSFPAMATRSSSLPLGGERGSGWVGVLLSVVEWMTAVHVCCPFEGALE